MTAAPPRPRWSAGPPSCRLSPVAEWTLVIDPLRETPRAGAICAVLVDAPGTTPAALAEALREAAGRAEDPGFGAPAAADAPFVLLVDRAALDALASGPALGPLAVVREVAVGPALPPEVQAPADTGAPQHTPSGAAEPGVAITAVIDTGLPLLNAAFRMQDGRGPDRSRVAHAWLQGVARPATGGGAVPHGRTFDAGALDAAIAAHWTAGVGLDEAAAYRALGLMDFTGTRGHSLGFAVTHGAHIGALAAGYPPEAARADRPVILVQLPDAVTADTSGAGLAPYFAEALDYVVDRAARIARARGCGPLPLVVNFSFGGTGGPLDGSSPVERRMDALIDARRAQCAATEIVLPAGNGRLSDGHARIRADDGFGAPDRTETLTWRLQPGDATASVVEIWTPKGPHDHRLQVALATPGPGTTDSWLGEDPGQTLDCRIGGTVVAWIRYDYLPEPTARGRFTIVAQATASPGAEAPLAPAGAWQLRLRDTGLPAGSHVDAWVLRDEELPGFDTDARQSRFADPRCRWRPRLQRPSPQDPAARDPGACPLAGQGLQNVLATGRAPVVAGGYVDRSGAAARYSAGGATNTADRPGPDATTVSDASDVHRGVISSAVLSGGAVALNGTSVAAPQLARRLAARMAAGAPAGRATVHRIAAESEATAFDGRAPTPPERRTGAGRIQLQPQTDRRYRPG